MFGRRNPDRPLNSTPPAPTESDLDLDLLEDLPDTSALTPAPAEPEAPPNELPDEPPAANDPSWHASTPTLLSPSVTRLLQAEAASQRSSSPAEAAIAPQSPAPAAPVTQQLIPVPPPAVAPVAAPTPPAVAPTAAPLPSLGGAAPAPPTLVASAARTRAVAESVIGPDDFFDGRYRSERGVRIQGNARGSIESRQYIYVEAGAQVEADLSAEDITVSGDFKGKIECRRRLEVTGSGKIHGQVQTSLLVVQEGGAIDGELHMGPASGGEAGAA
jgi:cytoskeletal protein CcmA (bactofilin family)